MLDWGANGTPWPNEKKQNIKHIKRGFEFSSFIFAQYFPTFTKNTVFLIQIFVKF